MANRVKIDKSKIILAWALIASVALAYVTYLNTPISESSEKQLAFNRLVQTIATMRGGVSLDLHIKAFDQEGNLVGEVYKESDPFVKNWQAFFAAIFGSDTNYARPNIITTTGGGTATIYGGLTSLNIFYGTITSENIAGTDYYSSFVIAIGTGTSPVGLGNYTLQSLVVKGIPFLTITESGNAFNITLSRSFTLASAYTISEAGLYFFSYYYTTAASTNYYLLARDTFTGISVPAGGSIEVKYIFRFNQ